uniref:Uncharacterized protein n=1 Tax=Timema monikensis TaxID=170555 RepID=A0A7R9E7J3_9NEOP|nr:unnamed protein product [Timema monikensis]
MDCKDAELANSVDGAFERTIPVKMAAPQTPEYHRLPPNSQPDSPAISTHSSVHGSIHSSVISNTQPIFTNRSTRILNLPNRAHNPRYVPNFGISRYKSAFQTLLPFRRGTRPEQEIAVDHVGICSYMSFNWVTGLLYKGYRTSSSEPEHIIGSPLDSCDVNGQRTDWLTYYSSIRLCLGGSSPLHQDAMASKGVVSWARLS